MTLNLNIADFELPAPKTPLVFEKVRELREADLELASTMPAGESPPELKKITDRHHMLARLLAAGTTEEEAAFQTGYSLSRVSILKNSPAFVELVKLYREKVDTEFASVIDHMAGLSKDALVELRDRLEDSPDRFTNNELQKIAAEFTDRTLDRDNDFDKLPTLIELVAPETAPPTGQASLEEEAGDSSSD